MKQHWLVRPATIRSLWIGFVLVLVLTLLAGLLAPAHGYFGLDGSFGFNGWYGFATCVGMILVARVLGYFLKRRDSYYDRD
jgi:uncharacterized membrane protein